MSRLLPFVLLAGTACEPDYGMPFGDCEATPIAAAGPDGPTALGQTPRELAQARASTSFEVVWVDPTNPAPTAWTLTLDPSTASASSMDWEAAEGCPSEPDVVLDVTGTLTSGDLTLEGTSVRLEWHAPEWDPGGPAYGDPVFSATFPPDDALEAWVHAAIEVDFPGEGDAQLNWVGLQGRLDDGSVQVNAEGIVDGEGRAYDLPAFDGVLTVVE